MRIAFHLPGGRLPEPLRGSGGESAGLLGVALHLAGHEVAAACRPGSRSDGSAPDRLLARHRQAPPEKRPEAWVSCAVSAETGDLLGPIVSRGLGIPYILVQPSLGPAAADARPEDASPDHTPLRSALAAADAVITIGRTGVESLRLLVEHPDRLFELSPFLDLEPISTAFRNRAQHRTALAARLLLPSEVPWLIAMPGEAAGRGEDSIGLLARALSRIPFLDWALVVVGDGPDCDAANAALRSLPRPRVRCYPSLEPKDLVPLYVAGDIFLGPAIGEGRGTESLLLAMASGLPIVVSRNRATEDVVRNGITGMLTEPGNAESFGNAINFLLRQPSFRKSFADNARNTALAEHDLGTAAAGLDGVLRRCTAGDTA